MKTLLSGSMAVLLAGCASISPDESFEEVQEVAQERLRARLQWIRGTVDDAEVGRGVRELLKQPLSLDAAVQIALLNNRELQAAYEDLGVAQSDLVQAGLLRNPVFGGVLRYPTEAPRSANIELDVALSFLELLFLPSRRQAAALSLEEAKLRVAHAVLALASRVRAAYYGAIAARQVADLRRLVADAADASAELARRLHAAGNLSELAWTLQQAAQAQARMDLSRAQTAVVATRERLTRLMGLWGSAAAWTAPEKLPDVPAEEMPLDRAERLAIARRLDLRAGLREVQAAAAALGLTRTTRWLGDDLHAGASAEREPGGDWLVGPSLEAEIPLFDQGQAKVARGTALLRQREHRLAALAVEIRSDVRELRDRLVQDRRRAEHYAKVIIPLRERAVALTQERYNFMLAGAFELLQAKREEFDAYQAYLEVVRDYWTTRSDFLHAIGGPDPETP